MIIRLGFVIMNASTIIIGVKYFSKEDIGLGNGSCLMIRWLEGAVGAAVSGSVMHAIPQHYLAKHLSQLPCSDSKQIQDMI